MIHGGDVWHGNPDDFLDFSANLRPEGPPDWVMQAASDALRYARYYPDLEMHRARAGIAQYLGIPESCVLPTAGGIAALDLLLSFYEDPVIINNPTFGEYTARAQVHRRTVSDMKGLHGTHIICNPNNPTGTALSPAAILERFHALPSGSRMIVDEAFIDFCTENTIRHTLEENLFIIGSLTKTLCIPGIRLGYIVALPEHIHLLRQYVLPWSLNMMATAVAEVLPEHLDSIQKDIHNNSRRRFLFTQSLQQLGFSVTPSSTNFLLCDFHRDMSEIVRLLQRNHILVRTCQSFGLGSNYLRLAVRTESQNDILIRELQHCLAS